MRLDNVSYNLSAFEGYNKSQFVKEGFRKDHWDALSKGLKNGNRSIPKKGK